MSLRLSRANTAINTFAASLKRRSLRSRGCLSSRSLAIAAGGVLALSSLADAGTVTAKVTADNLYMLGWGNSAGITTLLPPPPSLWCSATDIFSCGPGGVETYTLTSLTAASYIYLVAWSDDAVSQGVLAEFVDSSGKTVLSGPGWEVYATGLDYDPTCVAPLFPSKFQVNTQIAIANSVAGGAAASSSRHWVNNVAGVNGPGFGIFVAGETNTAGGIFPAIPCMNPATRWMWYTTDPTFTTIPDPFSGAGNQREYLIFRRPVADLIPCAPCPCPQPTQINYEAGRDDALAAPVDPVTPRTALKNWATNTFAKPLASFDDTGANKVFVHTFTNLPRCVCAATLTIKVRSNNGLSSNDTIALQYNGNGVGGTVGWSHNVDGLPGIPAGWGSGNGTMVLNLCTLPNANGTTTNLVDSINATGNLDVFFQDDTTVDWMKLTVSVCPPAGPWRTYLGGVIDDFAPNGNFSLEKFPTRSTALSNIRTTPGFLWKGFDSCALDLGMGYTMSVPPGIVAAVFDTQLEPCLPFTGSGNSNNDSISFDLKPGSPAAFTMSFGLANAPGQLFPGSWNSTQNVRQYFSFGLVNIFANNYANILGSMADGKLDWYVQDDTNVDFYRLRVKTCPPPVRLTGIAIDALGSATITPFPAAGGGFTISDFGTEDPGGVSFDAGGAQGLCIGLDNAVLAGTAPGAFMMFTVKGLGGEGEGSNVIETLKIEVSDGSVAHHWIVCDDRACASVVSILSGGVEVMSVTTDGPIETAAVVGGGFLPTLATVDWNSDRAPGGDDYDGFLARFNGDVRFTVGGQTAIGDSYSARRVEPGRQPIANIEFTGVNLPDIAVAGAKIEQFNHGHWALGSADLMLGTGLIGIENIDASGESGISIETGQSEAFEINLTTQLLPGESIPDGASFKASFTGSHGGVNAIDLGILLGILDVGHTRWAIDADYTPVGANLRTVQILRDGVLIQEIPDVAGFVGYAVDLTPGDATFRLPPDCGKGVAVLNGQRTACGRLRWPKLFRFEIGGRPGVAGNEIRVLAQNATAPFDFVERIDLTATGFPNLIITGETATPYSTGSDCSVCAADFNQDGGVDGSDVQAFFAAFEAGEACADVDQDGGVTGADVGYFFSRFEAGGC